MPSLKSVGDVTFLTLVVILALGCGYILGRIVSGPAAPAGPTELLIQPDTRTEAGTVVLERIVNNQLQGTVHGDAALFLQDTAVELRDDGTFLVPAGPLQYNIVEIHIPEGMHYVASKKGSRYYHVSSGSAERLSLENRVYFTTKEEAEAAGYRE